MPGTFSPPRTSKETASCRSRHASRHLRVARAVMHVGIAKPRWWGKRSRLSRRMRNPQFYVSGKRPMEEYCWTLMGRYRALFQILLVSLMAQQSGPMGHLWSRLILHVSVNILSMWNKGTSLNFAYFISIREFSCGAKTKKNLSILHNMYVETYINCTKATYLWPKQKIFLSHREQRMSSIGQVTIIVRSLAWVLGWVGGVASASEPSSAGTPCVL